MITLCEAHAASDAASPLRAVRDGKVWHITGERAGKQVAFAIDTTSDIPGVTFG